LKILHTYQKEQKGIKDVLEQVPGRALLTALLTSVLTLPPPPRSLPGHPGLEQVSQLFADHPDLLMEFTYFLPDAVQEQAKVVGRQIPPLRCRPPCVVVVASVGAHRRCHSHLLDA